MNLPRATLWAVNLLLVAGVAYAAAITTALVVERQLLVPPREEAAMRSERSAPPRKEARAFSDYQVLLDRNIFQAKRSPGAQEEPQPGSPSREAAAEPERDKLPIALTGTFVAKNGSFAMVVNQDDSSESIYRVGQCLPLEGDEPTTDCGGNQGRLVAVHPDAIVVERAAERQTFEITEVEAAAAQRARQQAKARQARRRQAAARQRAQQQREPAQQQKADAAGGSGPFPMEQQGNTYEITVPNNEVKAAFDNFTDIIRQARVVPVTENGEPQGFVIKKIQPDSIFERLGLQNFDLIKAVNGRNLTDADQALRLFTLFRNEREIVLDIERNEQPLTLSYTVQ